MPFYYSRRRLEYRKNIEHGQSSSSESETEENKRPEENALLDSNSSKRGQKQTKRLTRSRVKNSPRVKSRSNGLKKGPSPRAQQQNNAKSSSDDEGISSSIKIIITDFDQF